MLELYAIYFPQFYRLKENSEWWGEGFTDWDLVKRARPNYRGHMQPREPLLGYLDQSKIETVKNQAELAKSYCINGFNFYHYWFDSKPLLDKPVDNFLLSNTKDFGFFLTWANESWTRQWVGKPNDYLIKQNYYSDDKEIDLHYQYLSKYFKDVRYKKVSRKPVFCIYRPELIPNLDHIISRFNELAKSDGFCGLYLIAFRSYDISNAKALYSKFDAIMNFNPRYCLNTLGKNHIQCVLEKRLRRLPERFQSLLNFICKTKSNHKIFSYKMLIESLAQAEITFERKPIYNSVFPDWDNTPRYKKKSTSFVDVTVESFKLSLKKAILKTDSFETKIVFINAWNEWSEGAYLEPDMTNHYEVLSAIKEVVEGGDDYLMS